jgi:predicted nucleic acid-binding protein
MEYDNEELSDRKVKKYKCRNCSSYFSKKNMGHVCCSPKCDAEYRKNAAIKKENKKIEISKIKKKAVNEVTKRKLTTTLQTIFNKYIRLRDANDPCISCGAVNTMFHAGHYVSVGANVLLRFNEDNVHKQCAKCNTFMHGNLIEYRKNLIKKIGVERVEYLEYFHEHDSFTHESLQNMIQYYKMRVNDLSRD